MYKRIIATIGLFAFILVVNAQINIWENTELKKVELTPYLVSGKGNVAVIVCPGGSYFWHDMKAEGVDVAHWLNDNGISAFVLRYRTAYVPAFITHFRYVFRGNRYPDPQHDLARALELVRDNAEEFGVNRKAVGIMGFSAGGHLVISTTSLLEEKDYPSFIASIYPVVTMSEPCTHKRSRRALLGDNRKNNKTLQDSLSIEKHIPHACPPVFLMNCHDDPVVHYHNSELLDAALSAHNVPHIYIQYKTGGHGFGASEGKGSVESLQWKREFLTWLRTINILK